MPYSNSVSNYLPLKSIDIATQEYHEYFGDTHVTSSFILDLTKRNIIKSRQFANIPYIHVAMFDDWLIQHKNKNGRPYQKEGYMDYIDIGKDFECSDKYHNFSPNDIKVLIENKLIGEYVLIEKNKKYILRDNLNLFHQKEKLFCHNDIVKQVDNYIFENFGTISVNRIEILGFDIENVGSLIYRGYIKPKYYSDNCLNHAYLTTQSEVENCMAKLKSLIQFNAKNEKQKQIEAGFHFRLSSALTQKASIVNKLKPFNTPTIEQRKQFRQQLQNKFNVLSKFKTFLKNELEFIDINTNLNDFLLQAKEIIPFDYHDSIYKDNSLQCIRNVNITFDKEIEMYEEALLDEKKIF